MQIAILFSLLIFCLSVPFQTQAAWEKLIDCNNGAMVIDEDCSYVSPEKYGISQCDYQLVIRNQEAIQELLVNYFVRMPELIQRVNLDGAAGYFSNIKGVRTFRVTPLGRGYQISSYHDAYPIGHWYYDSCRTRYPHVDYRIRY